jgi:HK97 family phage major capsid protein
MTIKEILEKREGLIKQARDIFDKAENEEREPTQEERANFDKLMDEADNLKVKADSIARLEAAEKELNESRGRQTTMERADNGNDGAGNRTDPQIIELRNNIVGDNRSVVCSGPLAAPEYRDDFRSFLRTGGVTSRLIEGRALQKDSDVGGGYLSAPIQFMAELIAGLDDEVFMRRISRVLPPITAADSLGAPSLDSDVSDSDWTPELATGQEDTGLSFGMRQLTPHPLAKRVKISKTLLRRSTMNADTIVRDRLRYKFGITQEKTFLTGNGSQQPLGVFTASSQGISTGRDVSTGNTSTEIRFDGLIEALYKLKGQYQGRAEWIFHRDAIKQIRKLKDGEGRYIWQASVQAGQPDLILNRPYYMSEYAPNTFTASQYVGIVGDFQWYWIVDALTLIIQVLVELYAESNQNGYIGRLEADGMPVLEEAFARVKLGS